MNRLLIAVIFFMSVCNVDAQTKDEEAKAYFQKAEDAFENGNYVDCYNFLNKVREVLGDTNPKIIYLKIKCLDEGLKKGSFNSTYNNINITYNNCNIFFQIIDKSSYPADKYNDIVNIKINLQEKLQPFLAKRQLYESLTKRFEQFVKDTIDVYASAFCEKYNKELEISHLNGYRPKEFYTTNDDNPHLFDSIVYNKRKTAFQLCESFSKGPRKGPVPWLTYLQLLKPFKVFTSKAIMGDGITMGIKGIVVQISTEEESNSPAITQLEKDAVESSNIDISSSKNSFYKINYFHSGKKGKSYDLSSSIGIIKELINIINTTGFYDYFNGMFDDVRDVQL